MKQSGKNTLIFLILAILGVAFVLLMNHQFSAGGAVKNLFVGSSGTEALGKVAANSPESLASRDEFFGRISMLLFSIITCAQFFAFALAWMVTANIKNSAESFKLRLQKLENADIFFDVPLYVGLFGTVSAFLVMTFSPQNSRLIAYSSTLIGIIFSLILRLILLYPLRRELLAGNENSEAAK
ncbi:MAG: hypothetical protein IJZ19_04770 [Lentisphaeria bacterium]|nr:hypothetical protein [Lentisphaeria bacterium]MBQ9774783.1 hypothetical protein [Lentisphaeria bacterium]